MNDHRSNVIDLLQAAKDVSPTQLTAYESILRTWFFDAPHDDYDLLNGALTELRFAVDERAYSSPVAEINGILDETISLIRAKQQPEGDSFH
jgi:hypothetical protein